MDVSNDPYTRQYKGECNPVPTQSSTNSSHPSYMITYCTSDYLRKRQWSFDVNKRLLMTKTE